jgi:predicted nucleic acid-binding protein
VPGYFIDTSALAKLYHAEVSNQQMEMLAQSQDNRLIVSQLSVIELQSVFAARVRMGVIDQASLNQLRGLFFADLAAGRFKVVLFAVRYFRSADRLIRTHAVSRTLRTLDALKLAVALPQPWSLRRETCAKWRPSQECKSLTRFKARK